VARSRNIKPGFFTNEDLVELDFATRILFAGLWTVADKAGRLEDRPKKIKIAVFPADDLDIDSMLTALAGKNFITRYSVGGVAYIQINAWAKHQNPHHTEKASTIPPPQSNGGLTVKEPLEAGGNKERDGGNPADSLIPDSLIPSVPNGTDSGPAPRAAPPTPPPPFDGRNAEVLNGKAIVSIAIGWELPEQWGVDAEALGWRPAQVLKESEKFRQYWTAGRGQGTRRSVKGWRQAWSNWLEKAAKDQR
jgi:hypothetical protein